MAAETSKLHSGSCGAPNPPGRHLNSETDLAGMAAPLRRHQPSPDSRARGFPPRLAGGPEQVFNVKRSLGSHVTVSGAHLCLLDCMLGTAFCALAASDSAKASRNATFSTCKVSFKLSPETHSLIWSPAKLHLHVLQQTRPLTHHPHAGFRHS